MGYGERVISGSLVTGLFYLSLSLFLGRSLPPSVSHLCHSALDSIYSLSHSSHLIPFHICIHFISAYLHLSPFISAYLNQPSLPTTCQPISLSLSLSLSLSPTIYQPIHIDLSPSTVLISTSCPVYLHHPLHNSTDLYSFLLTITIAPLW